MMVSFVCVLSCVAYAGFGVIGWQDLFGWVCWCVRCGFLFCVTWCGIWIVC